MNSVSYKNNSYLKKLIVNYEILMALKSNKIEQLKKLLEDNKSCLFSSNSKAEPHYQNIQLVNFFLNNNSSNMLKRFSKNPELLHQICEFVQLGMLSESTINKGNDSISPYFSSYSALIYLYSGSIRTSMYQ